jgi:hypothetical protein
MTAGASRAPGHHLFWSTPKGRLIHYRAGGHRGRLPRTADVSIWKLRRRFPTLSDWLSFDRALRTGVRAPRLSEQARSVLELLLDSGADIAPASRRLLFGILMMGPQTGIAQMAEQLPKFAKMLTPHYRAMLSTLAPTFQSSADLTFLSCRPDLYLWLPPDSEARSEVLVCFCTSSNSLNAPLPVAHAALATRRMPICYVFNRKNRFVYKGLPGRDADQSGRMIGQLLDRLGLTQRYGLGTSLGGYTACRYATSLGLQRVLNFSGWPDKSSEPGSDPHCLSKAIGAFPQDRVLSVLSSTDANDHAILQGYDEDPFVTRRCFVETQTHGSLLAAIIEGRLDDLLDWLFSGTHFEGLIDPAAVQ